MKMVNVTAIETFVYGFIAGVSTWCIWNELYPKYKLYKAKGRTKGS